MNNWSSSTLAVPKEEVLKFGTGSMRKAVFDGDLAGGSFLAGEVAGMIKKKETAKEIVEDLMDGAEKLLANPVIEDYEIAI